MPDTLTLEEATQPDTMTLEEATAPEPAGAQLAPDWKPRLDASQMLVGPGGVKRESGMEADPSATLAPIMAAASIPGKLLQPVSSEAGRVLTDFLHRSGIDPSAQEDKPLVSLPQVPGDKWYHGVKNLVRGTVESFTTPENAVIMALMPGKGSIAKAASLLFGSQQLAALPEQVQGAIETINDPKASTADKVKAAGQPVVGALLGATMLKHGLKRPEGAAVPTATPPPEPTPAPAAEPIEKKPFEADDKLVMRSPHTGEDTAVNYRGKLPNGQAVVWTGKSQFPIPMEWLRREGEKYEEPKSKIAQPVVEKPVVDKWTQAESSSEIQKPDGRSGGPATRTYLGYTIESTPEATQVGYSTPTKIFGKGRRIGGFNVTQLDGYVRHFGTLKEAKAWIDENPAEPTPPPAVAPVAPKPTTAEGTAKAEEPKPAETEKGIGPETTSPTPDTRTPVQILNASQRVAVTAPEGATKLRVTDAKGRKAEIWIKDFKKGNPAFKTDITKIEAGTVTRDGKFQPLTGDVKVTDATPPKPPLGFGGGVRPPKPPVPPAADPTPGPAPATPEELSAVQTQKTPGLLSSTLQGFKSLLLPSSKGPDSLKAAELLSSKLGPMHRRGESSAFQLRPFRRMFDKLGVSREGVAPTDNKGIKFMSDMSQGRPMTGKFKAASDLVQKMFDIRLAALEKAGAALQTIRENYFPGMWTKESRLAFNAAIERMGKDFDVNKATPEQRAAIKAQVDKFLEDGTTSDKDALGYLTRKPLAGKESFRKQKVFQDIMDAAEFGLRPISNNPIDLVMLKLAEMDKSIMANEFFKDPRAGVQIINPYEEVGPGRVKINDKYGTIYGKPTVTIPEYIDQNVYQGLLKTAAALGISHERLMRFPPGPGNRALGLSYTGQNRILSRFGTETSVIAHEIGHQLDEKYGLWDFLTGGERGNERKSPIQKELRAIAEETERGKKAKEKKEKIAQVMEAYIHAPERMKEIAPTIFAKFDAFVKSTPELQAFSEIKPGLALEKMTGSKYVGLPIMGYRTVPEHVGEIINNYLSSSLYNNRYFGSLYKDWMAFANVLGQSQLGMGSAFHAGFTTVESQISSGANVLKDIYGVLRGNRSATDLGKTIANSTVATIRNPVVGDQVLNAWRNPEGQINPRIAQVVRAAELGGGGFKMESGLRTEQSTKLIRDWYSGHRLRAAARSPVALTELLAKPTMELIVPRQKAGVFADLALRIIDQNPGKSLEELTPQFRAAWNRVDARLGQVRYDRLFINNTAKNIIQGLVRAPGWSGGTIAEIGGGFMDAGKFMSEWVKTGKLPDNLPDRTAYVISMLATVGTINAALTYAFTGTAPKGMDYFAFRTGKKDEQGRDERFLIPSYVKDLLAYARHPGETLLNKSHPLISMLSDIVKNKDYYGVEVRSRGEGIATQAGQTAAFVAKGFEPFWTRGTRREVQRGAGVVSPRTVAPFFGVMPAPRAVTQTPAESLAHDLMMEQIPSGPRTRAQAERSMAKSQGNTTPYLERTIKKLSAHSAFLVYQKANAQERKLIYDEVDGKIDRSKTLSDDEKDELRKRMAKP